MTKLKCEDCWLLAKLVMALPLLRWAETAKAGLRLLCAATPAAALAVGISLRLAEGGHRDRVHKLVSLFYPPRPRRRPEIPTIPPSPAPDPPGPRFPPGAR